MNVPLRVTPVRAQQRRGVRGAVHRWESMKCSQAEGEEGRVHVQDGGSPAHHLGKCCEGRSCSRGCFPPEMLKTGVWSSDVPQLGAPLFKASSRHSSLPSFTQCSPPAADVGIAMIDKRKKGGEGSGGSNALPPLPICNESEQAVRILWFLSVQSLSPTFTSSRFSHLQCCDISGCTIKTSKECVCYRLLMKKFW